MNDKMKVCIQKRDLAGVYASNTDCPLGRALKRKFPTIFIHVGWPNVIIGEETWKFDPDKWGAKQDHDWKNYFPNRETRTLTLTK